jgi:hypothetical protein
MSKPNVISTAANRSLDMYLSHSSIPTFVLSIVLSVAAIGSANAQIFDDGSGAPNSISEYTMSGTMMTDSVIPVADAWPWTVSGTDVFAYNPTTGAVGEYTTSGGTVNASLIPSLDQGFSFCNQIAISGSDLFIANSQSGDVAEYSTSGALLNPTFMTSSANSEPLIAISGTDVFVAHGTPSGYWTVGEYTAAGATVNSSLFTYLFPTSSMAVSGSDIFVNDWSAATGDTIAEYTTSGNLVSSSFISGPAVTGPYVRGSTYGPTALTTSGSDLYIQLSTGTVEEFDTSGTLLNGSVITGGGNMGGLAVVQAVPEPSGCLMIVISITGLGIIGTKWHGKTKRKLA